MQVQLICKHLTSAVPPCSRGVNIFECSVWRGGARKEQLWPFFILLESMLDSFMPLEVQDCKESHKGSKIFFGSVHLIPMPSSKSRPPALVPTFLEQATGAFLKSTVQSVMYAVLHFVALSLVGFMGCARSSTQVLESLKMTNATTSDLETQLR